MIAGGADHGTIVQRSIRCGALADEIDSAGMPCQAFRVVKNGEFSQAIFRSPEATDGEVNEVSERLALLIEVIKRNTYRAVTGVRDIDFDAIQDSHRA